MAEDHEIVSVKAMVQLDDEEVLPAQIKHSCNQDVDWSACDLAPNSFMGVCADTLEEAAILGRRSFVILMVALPAGILGARAAKVPHLDSPRPAMFCRRL